MELKNYLMDEYRDTNKYLDKFSRSGLSAFAPLIVSCAITGGNQGKEANPNLPETPDEQAQQTYDAYNAGASIVHVHRRSSQNPAIMTSDPVEYREINAMIRERCPDIIINNTSGGGRIRFNNGTVSPPFTVSLSACPEMASFDISNFVARALLKKRPAPLTGRNEDVVLEYAYSIMPAEAEEFLKLARQYNIKPEYECFDIGDLQYLKGFIRAGLVDGPHWIQMVFTEATCFPTLQYLVTAINCLPDNSLFSVIGVGPVQFPILAAAIVAGAHVRVGMEDNIYLEKGRLAKSNAELVEKIVRIATELGRPIATPAQARQMLKLGTPRDFKYNK